MESRPCLHSLKSRHAPVVDASELVYLANTLYNSLLALTHFVCINKRVLQDLLSLEQCTLLTASNGSTNFSLICSSTTSFATGLRLPVTFRCYQKHFTFNLLMLKHFQFLSSLLGVHLWLLSLVLTFLMLLLQVLHLQLLQLSEYLHQLHAWKNRPFLGADGVHDMPQPCAVAPRPDLCSFARTHRTSTHLGHLLSWLQLVTLPDWNAPCWDKRAGRPRGVDRT